LAFHLVFCFVWFCFVLFCFVFFGLVWFGLVFVVVFCFVFFVCVVQSFFFPSNDKTDIKMTAFPGQSEEQVTISGSSVFERARYVLVIFCFYNRPKWTNQGKA